jgi:excisionase family DNA binding protein
MGESEEKSMSDANGGGGRSTARPRPDSDKKCYTVPEAAQLLGFSRNFGYELARTGQIPILRFGKRLVVPKAAFDRMLESRTDISNGG